MTVRLILVALAAVMTVVTGWGIVAFLVDWRTPTRRLPPGW